LAYRLRCCVLALGSAPRAARCADMLLTIYLVCSLLVHVWKCWGRGAGRPYGTASLLAVYDDDGPQLYLVEPSGAGHVRAQPLLSRALLWLPDKWLCSMVEAPWTVLKACMSARSGQAKLAEASVRPCCGCRCKPFLKRPHSSYARR